MTESTPEFDFTSIIDRKGKDALAIDGIGGPEGFAPGAPQAGFDAIPMWVADMNFATVPAIQEAIIKRVQHPLFGYFRPPVEYYDRIITWHRNHNHVDYIKPEHIGYENGVLGGVVSALRACAAPGDAVLLHSPTYIGFTHCMEDNGFHMVLSPLVLDEHGVWRMDYEDMAAKLEEYNIHVAVFCSPHNPCGRVWERWEIERAMQVYAEHDCIVISDEIWSDIILEGQHIPTQSVSEDARNRTIALYAPSKTFNLAGLIGSYHIVPNQYLRDRMTAIGSKTYYNDMNVLSMHALIGAYSGQGERWLDQLLQTLRTNIDIMHHYLTQEVSGIQVARPQGTYMLFLDCTEYCKQHEVTIEELTQRGWDCGVAWQNGVMFKMENAIRLNVALPTSRVEEAIHRLRQYVFTD